MYSPQSISLNVKVNSQLIQYVIIEMVIFIIICWNYLAELFIFKTGDEIEGKHLNGKNGHAGSIVKVVWVIQSFLVLKLCLINKLLGI